MKPLQATQEALQAIEAAIQIEQDGITFYTQAAKQTDDPTGKKMFQTLAQDERAHLEVFEKAREALSQREQWLTPEQVAEISPPTFPQPPIFPSPDEAAGTAAPAHRLTVLQQGIQAEESSIRFYTEQMEQTQDPGGRAMYEFLIEQEEAHRTILQGEYDYLTNTGHWFGFQEFTLEGPS